MYSIIQRPLPRMSPSTGINQNFPSFVLVKMCCTFNIETSVYQHFALTYHSKSAFRDELLAITRKIMKSPPSTAADCHRHRPIAVTYSSSCTLLVSYPLTHRYYFILPSLPMRLDFRIQAQISSSSAKSRAVVDGRMDGD